MKWQLDQKARLAVISRVSRPLHSSSSRFYQGPLFVSHWLGHTTSGVILSSYKTWLESSASDTILLILILKVLSKFHHEVYQTQVSLSFFHKYRPKATWGSKVLFHLIIIEESQGKNSRQEPGSRN